MNILKNRTVLGLICIILSLITCFGLTPMFNGAVKAQVEIIRMVKDVKQGDIITADMVTAVKVGGYNLPDNVVLKRENIVGKYARHDMLNGDYILSGKLSDWPTKCCGFAMPTLKRFPTLRHICRLYPGQNLNPTAISRCFPI